MDPRSRQGFCLGCLVIAAVSIGCLRSQCTGSKCFSFNYATVFCGRQARQGVFIYKRNAQSVNQTEKLDLAARKSSIFLPFILSYDHHKYPHRPMTLSKQRTKSICRPALCLKLFSISLFLPTMVFLHFI